MRNTVPFPLAGIAVLLGFTAAAQPYKYGCHYFRQHPPGSVHVESGDRDQIDGTIARSDTFDILHYDIALDVTDVAHELLRAATTVSYAALRPGRTSITFDLYQLTVDSVRDASGLLAFDYDDAFLTVHLAAAAEVGTPQDVTVYYHGTPYRDPDWGGFYFEDGYIYNLGIGLTTIPPNFGKVWYPCFDSFVERATYTYHVKSAGTYRAHCQGDFLGEVQLGGDTVVRSFTMQQPIPTHLSAIAAADYQDVDLMHTGANGDIPVRLTAKPAQLGVMQARFADIGAAIDACEHWYGPYAWGRVGYVMTTDGALEIPTNIAYPDFMNSQNVGENRALFTHELGHHWWGDMVTPYTHHDMWLKEGPAEYSAHLVEEWIGGESAFVKAVKDNQLYVLEQANVQDGGFQPLSPMPDAYIYGIHTYNKGAAVMHNLRAYLGDDLFRAAMYGVQQHHAYGTLTSEQFKEALEAETGADLDPFFDAWVFAPGFSTFVVKEWPMTPSGTGYDVHLNVQQKLRGAPAMHHQVPLDITFVGPQWQRTTTGAVMDGAFTDVDVYVPFEPKMVVLNGFNRLNQARMDHEVVVHAEGAFITILPHVDFQLFRDSIVDSALVRVEHIWAGPDNDLGPGITALSSTHYWTVDGIWPEGTRFRGRVTYSGALATDLDNDLYGITEENAVLVYRPTPLDPWTIYPDQTWSPNVLTNGVGNFTMTVLRKGQYAFAKRDPFAGVAELDGADGLHVFPVPARDAVTIAGRGAVGEATYEVRDAEGRLQLMAGGAFGEGTRKRMDVSTLAAGSYLVGVRDASGTMIGRARFTVQH